MLLLQRRDQLARVRRNPTTGFLEVRGGTGSGTLLATGTMAVNVAPLLIEVHYKPHDTAGVFQVRVGGVLDIDFNGDTTDGATAIDGIRVGGDGTYSPPAGLTTWSSMTPPGRGIPGSRPSGPPRPGPTEWDPSAGAN